MKLNKKALYSIVVENEEFFKFIKKFIGALVFKGNKVKAIMLFDEILYRLKKTFRRSPIDVFYVIFLRLVPIFSIAYKRMGNRYQPVPKLANKNVRVVLMVDWLIRSLKGKSNSRGVKVIDIIKILIDTYKGKGKAIALKKAFYRRALSGRHLLNIYKKKNSKLNYKRIRQRGVVF